ISLALFAALLVALPLLRQTAPGMGLALADSFYRAGALVFGGGHVVLPMLEREVVPAGWVSPETFLAGYGAAQAVPGPLFTFAAYLGAAAAGGAGAALATAAVFLPGFLLVVGALPFWNALRTHARMQGALTGINAAVVGLLLAALYDPIWTSAVRSPADFAAAAVLFGLLVFWKLPPWAVVLAGASAGWGLSLGLV
ncbi:chromate efflux transporter, partial [Paenibacillus ehimensis]